MRRNRITTFVSVFVIPLVLALALPAMASEQNGKIAGTVFDPDGVPLAGVTITITANEMMGKRQSQTAEDGSFLFFGLPPGKYTIFIEQPGFLPLKQEAVPVRIGGTVTLDLLMELPTAEETVVVTARRPVVDKEKTSLGLNFDDEYLESVPIDRQYQSVAALAPGVVSPDDNPNIHGGAFNSNQYLVDGVNTTDPVTNTFSANFNFDAIKEVQVLTGGLDAEYGQATGGIINLVTKSGGNEFHLDTSFYARPGFLRIKDEFEKEGAPTNDMYTFNVNVGGPILKDKLWYFASVQVNRQIYKISATEDLFNPANPEKVQHPAWEWFSVYYLGKLTYQPHDAHKITFMTQGDPTWLKNELQDIFVRDDAEAQRFQGGQFYSLAWEALWTKSLFQKTQLALKQSRLHIYPSSGCTDTQDPACRAHYDSATGLSSGNYDQDYDVSRWRIQFDSSWTYYLDNLLGDHEFKTGWQYTHSWQDKIVSIPGGGTYSDRAGQPYRFTRLTLDENGVPNSLDTLIYGDVLGVYFQDAWKITKDITVKPGIRFDWAQMLNEDGRTITEFATTSPRINMVWDITGDGKTVMRAGYNRYVDTGYLALSSFVGKGMSTETYEYNPVTGDYDTFLRSTGGENTVQVKDNLTAPHADELTLQFERELFTDFSLAINGLWRETKYVFEDDEANLIWNQEGSDVIGYKNGEESYIWSLGTPREAWRRYWGLEFVFRKAFSDNWQMSGSYTYSRSEGAPNDYISSYMDNPRQNEYWWSYLSYDRRHALKVDGSYHFPYGIEVGVGVRWYTGYPYTKITYNTFWGGYADYDWYRGYDKDHPDNPYWNRLPDIFRLNLRVVWDLKELSGHNIDLITEIFNVLHLRDKTGLVTSDYPDGSTLQYGEFTQNTSGFSAALGVRYRY
ncbi:MAG: TonB-dependent receptor [Deltaproteobacteria bacterium]|nr:TonB-dependent receptor [Deltaproteobacteria bacterium]